tara:strand:+ start:4248 stop:5414 length:1167 start_codon:yes stop_codon:yes gene_type:complete
MAIAGTNIQLDSTEGMDKITTTEKVTSPYFSDGKTTLEAANIISASLSDTNETYFFGVANSATPTVTEFNVAFGSTNGYGSLVQPNTKSETEAVYKQYASLLLAPTEVTGGFFISSQGSAGKLSAKDEEIYVMSARRSNMKDRINKGSWTIILSGSKTKIEENSTVVSANSPVLKLTDDSTLETPTATPAGDRYNIVSGSGGTISGSGASHRNYGFFYPDMGIMVFSAQELSASLPGSGSGITVPAAFNSGSGIGGAMLKAGTFEGFGYSTRTDANMNTALRFINCLHGGVATNNTSKLTFRDEEDQVSAQYFCRVRSGHSNFSNNPTFVSGSLNELRQKTMRGNPTTFISAVQLYNGAGELVAVGNLSTPLKKNFSSEATIKVKLTY